MTPDNQPEISQLQNQWSNRAAEIRTLAETYQRDRLAVLYLLRGLEQLHRDICDRFFQAALPENRQELYAVLREIEEEGGWPYIEKMTLRNILSALPEDFWLKESPVAGEVKETER